jgi:DHA1 family bicyclomycin/chloramphenicol resistance-like MFS transporter
VGVVGLTVLTPILPLIRSDLQVSSAAAQQLFSGYLIALAVGQLVWGTLSDRYGRRPVLLIGAALFTLSGCAVFFLEDIRVLATFRLLQGFGAAACMAMARAIVNDVFERTEAARTISTISMVLSVAPAISLAGAGWLAESAGWKSTMAVLFVCGLLVLLCGYRLIKETNLKPLEKIDAGTVGRTYMELLGNPLFNFWTLASGMQVGIFFCLNSFLAYQYQRNGYSLAEFGVWFSLTPLFYLVGNSCNRAWFVQRGIERAALTGCFLSLIATLSMLVTQSIGFTHALSLALPCCLFGFANGIIVANTTVGAITAAGRHRGSGTGIVGAWQMATGGIASAIIVAIGGAQNFTIAGTAVIAMACVSVGSMLYVFNHRELSAPD